MNVQTNNIIEKIKDQLTPAEFEQLVQSLQEEPEEFLNNLTEQPTSNTTEFLSDIGVFMKNMELDFEHNQSLLRIIINHAEALKNYAYKLSKLKFSEIKFILVYLLEADEGEFLVRFLAENLADDLLGTDYTALSQDKRFKAYF